MNWNIFYCFITMFTYVFTSLRVGALFEQDDILLMFWLETPQGI